VKHCSGIRATVKVDVLSRVVGAMPARLHVKFEGWTPQKGLYQQPPVSGSEPPLPVDSAPQERDRWNQIRPDGRNDRSTPWPPLTA